MQSEEFPNMENLTPSENQETSRSDSEAETELQAKVESLQEQKNQLEQEITQLQGRKQELIASQTLDLQQKIEQMVTSGLSELEQRKQALLISIEQLEKRRERIEQEMRSSFAGVSQELAIRVQGFKDYLVGSLQDLAAAAEQLELSAGEPWETSSSMGAITESMPAESPGLPQSTLTPQKRQVEAILEQYRSRPDYYGPPWQLRRTFEPIHAERIETWFFTQSGRGAIRSMGSRLQNILVASTAISILYQMHGDRLRTMILADTPERVGEWRRGLQDCLGISRSDFGSNRGIVLFENPAALAQKAERLQEEGDLPLIIIDEMEGQVSLSLLQFPLWLAFAPEAEATSNYLY